MKLIEVVAEQGLLDTIVGVAEQYGALDCWHTAPGEGQRSGVRMLVSDEARQNVLDALQSLLANIEDARIVVLPVEAVLPRPKTTEVARERERSAGATREELYSSIEKGARLDGNFLVLVFLSTVVATIGLLEDNVAIVIGAMVIAPLLGPNIALAFAATLGDRDLLRLSVKTNLAGVSLSLSLAVAIGLLWPHAEFGSEVLARTDVGFDGMVLALASGAAAVLSLTTGIASALVGVMVAVALLPPAATIGLMLAAGRLEAASGAALLLAVNVVSVNLAANLVFLFKGVRPRTWLQKRQARQSRVWMGVFWITALAMLVVAMYLRQLATTP